MRSIILTLSGSLNIEPLRLLTSYESFLRYRKTRSLEHTAQSLIVARQLVDSYQVACGTFSLASSCSP